MGTGQVVAAGKGQADPQVSGMPTEATGGRLGMQSQEATPGSWTPPGPRLEAPERENVAHAQGLACPLLAYHVAGAGKPREASRGCGEGPTVP